MSTQITAAFVKQFGSNIYTLAQQKGSRLRSAVRLETVVGDSAFFDRIGSVTAQQKLSRHSDTPQSDTPHSRRMVVMSDYEWADYIDKEDKLKTLIDPTNPYVQAGMWALGRSIDDVLIAALLGTAATGVAGAGTASLANANKVAAHDGTTTTGVNLNVRTLRAVKKYFDASDIDESIPRYMAITSSQLQSLLAETQVTSSDYNSIKALVQGELNTFMGFNFIRTERLGVASSNVTYTVTNGVVGAGTGTATAAAARRCIAWCGDGAVLALGADITAKVSERADKSYLKQAYASMSIGAVRMEEAKVCEVICAEV